MLVTVILSDSEVPKLRDSSKPYQAGAVPVTPAMRDSAQALLRDPAATAAFIVECEA